MYVLRIISIIFSFSTHEHGVKSRIFELLLFLLGLKEGSWYFWTIVLQRLILSTCTLIFCSSATAIFSFIVTKLLCLATQQRGAHGIFLEPWTVEYAWHIGSIYSRYTMHLLSQSFFSKKVFSNCLLIFAMCKPTEPWWDREALLCNS